MAASEMKDGSYLILNPVQRLPPKPKDGNDQRNFSHYLVKDTRQRTGHEIVDNPEG